MHQPWFVDAHPAHAGVAAAIAAGKEEGDAGAGGPGGPDEYAPSADLLPAAGLVTSSEVGGAARKTHMSSC